MADLNLTLDTLYKIIDESFPNESDMSEIDRARKRLANQLLDLMENNLTDVQSIDPVLIVNNPKILIGDAILCGEISGADGDQFICVDIPPINIGISLTKSVQMAIKMKKPELIHLLIDRQLDLFKINPKIMIQCIATEQFDLLASLVQIRVPISHENYRCLYSLAANGNLEFVNLMVNSYEFIDPPFEEIVCKICIQAIMNNHTNILEHYLTPDAFQGAPDIMLTFFLNGIEYGHLNIIRFFVENGINIRANDYQAVKRTIELRNKELFGYFYLIDKSVEELLTLPERKIFLEENLTEKFFIGLSKSCSIYYDDILRSDQYFKCDNNIHYFRELAWKEYIKRKDSWTCPHCRCPVSRTIYINE